MNPLEMRHYIGNVSCRISEKTYYLLSIAKSINNDQDDFEIELNQDGDDPLKVVIDIYKLKDVDDVQIDAFVDRINRALGVFV